MAATTTLLGLVTPTQGTLSGTWGDTVNYGISDYVDIAVAGTLTLTGDGAVTLANTTGSSSGSNITSTLAGAGTVTAQFSTVRVSGTTTTKVVTGPSYSKTYLVDNASSFAVTFKASGQTGVSISPNEKVYVYYNATDYVKVGGGGITYGAVKTTTYTAVANDGVLTNTTGGAFTVNLPATPSTGTQVFIADSAGTWATNNLTIGRNGSTIEGSGTDLVCDINGVNIQCVYNGTTWDIFAQIGANDTAVVTLNGTQTLTNKTLTAPTITSPTVTGTGTIAAATVTLSSTLAVTGVSTFSAGTAALPALTTTGDTNTGIFFPAADTVATSVAGTEGMRLTSTGLGIGTSSVGSPLIVLKSFTTDNLVYFGNTSVTAGASFGLKIAAGTNGSDYALGVDNAAATVALFRLYGDGTVKTKSTIGVGDAAPSASGAGITFPATQSASSDANTLDDYEEGTWSPVLAPSSSGSITMNGSFTSGKYTKVGRLVICTASLYVSSVSSPTGNLFITGLPFTVLAPSSAGSFWGSGMTSSANNSIVMRISSSSTEVLVQGFASGAVVAAAPWVQAATEMNVTLTYFV